MEKGLNHGFRHSWGSHNASQVITSPLLHPLLEHSSQTCSFPDIPGCSMTHNFLVFLFVSLFLWTEMNLSPFSFTTLYSLLETAKQLISFNPFSLLLSVFTIPHTPLLQPLKQCTSCTPYVSVPCFDHEPLKVTGFMSIMCLCRKWYRLAVKDREGGKDRLKERQREGER